MSSTAAPPDAPIQVLLDDVLEIPDEQFAAMSPVAELIVGELLAFEFTRPDLTATLAVSEFEPTFHEHQIRPDSNARVLFNKAHNLRELYVSGYRSIEVRSPCTSIVEHMPIGSEAFWQHLDSVEQLKSTISDNVDWLSNVEVNDKRDAAYIKLASALLVAFRTPSLQSRKVAHHVGVCMHHSALYLHKAELFPTQASSGVFTNRNSRGQARIFFLNGHRVVSCLDTYNSSMQTVEPPAGFGFDGHTWRVLGPQAQARYYQLQSFEGVLVASLAPIRKGLAHAGEERGINADGGSGADKRSGSSQGPSGRLSKRTRR
ncbi:BZ3500_MvSof-1268-A1-R1_Chr2-1g04482 [Microbotryum saponariae]|uniref:BZ3500_MvSof-1268-A1-R1_Chr2-1g04482 protein n=1 Tax=Microbotryum saponariae TaxID=289078 RepID=A0A2X0MJC1_9BASI|nr:BZ3500_MvSof-1268-A1-R1_Chr2-1g04482 [Microbotryum saponariae]SCZ91805.1 BZ3501_MvSof-1269-A2-R1_Chr2-1g04138 [Microbotryum saponariae]